MLLLLLLAVLLLVLLLALLLTRLLSYASNATYMAAVADIAIRPPPWVPMAELHPAERAQITLKRGLNADSVPNATLIHFRRVYFSMCYEADQLFGSIIDAMDASVGKAARQKTYVIMISDHGEDNLEHRQTGKNNMYDAASRVAMILSGPGIAPKQVVTQHMTSLNDVFPTVLQMARLAPTPSSPKLAGSSLIPLVDGTGDPQRRDHVIAQYHSVSSVTGNFMVRKGDFKLITYGPNFFEADYPRQLFNLKEDPWELHDLITDTTLAPSVAELQKLLDAEFNSTAIDVRAKQMQMKLFKNAYYDPVCPAAAAAADAASCGCQAMFQRIFGVPGNSRGNATHGTGFNASDAAKAALWLGAPCPFTAAGPVDPGCERGIRDRTAGVCCLKSCGACARSKQPPIVPGGCGSRSGGKLGCCPQTIASGNRSCASFAAPCVLGPDGSSTAR